MRARQPRHGSLLPPHQQDQLRQCRSPFSTGYTGRIASWRASRGRRLSATAASVAGLLAHASASSRKRLRRLGPIAWTAAASASEPSRNSSWLRAMSTTRAAFRNCMASDRRRSGRFDKSASPHPRAAVQAFISLCSRPIVCGSSCASTGPAQSTDRRTDRAVGDRHDPAVEPLGSEQRAIRCRHEPLSARCRDRTSHAPVVPGPTRPSHSRHVPSVLLT